ncbi:hypothetical protein ZWY2020_030144 [Hordeum vulgare]|nr:hypothetical protein ZWY2020_030144 [Hordeum vulgare]
MVIAPPYRQAKPSANIKQNDGKNKKKRQQAEVGEDSKNRGSHDSSAGSGSGNTQSDNDFNPANGSEAGEDESDREVDEEEPTHIHIEANLQSVLDKNENAIESAQDKSSELTEMTHAQVEAAHDIARQESDEKRQDMLKHKVVIENKEMNEVQCGMVEVEIPQFAEEIDTSARDTQAVEVLEDSEDERKDDSQDLQWEHERKDPPIKSDRPPGPSKENIKICEQRIIDQRKHDAAISVPRETSKGVKRTVERNPPVSNTSCTCESLEFLRPKTLASEEEVTLFLESLSPAQVDTYNELVVKGQMDFQHFKTALVMEAENNYNKEAYECLARLQSDSPDTSARQSSEITTANIISIKRPLKRSTRVYGVTKIPTFEHQHFIHMDKDKALHDYLMSDEGQKECRNANLYKSAVREDCITGQIMLDQLQKGGKGQMEATMCNALFEEWTEQKQYNTSDKAILTAKFANLELGLEYEDGGLKEFNEDDSLQQFEATMKGINLLDKKLIMIPHNTTSHHMLYVLNKYENRLDILDSLDYKKCIMKTWRHQRRSCKELIERMYVLLRRHYGEVALKAHDESNWGQLTARPRRVNTPKQKDAQCGQFMVQFAKYWNDQSLAKDDDELRHILKIDNPSQGVAKFKMELLDQKEQLIPLYLSEKQQKKFLTANMDDLEIWKAETLYILLLSEVNEVKPHAMGQEILKVLHMDEE